MKSNKTLIYICGPTAVGKTNVSIALAKQLNAEIISCDSRQFYKEMTIGTSVPSKIDLNHVKHYFIKNKSIKKEFTIGDFEKEAIILLKDLFIEKKYVIMTGGSGMYADSLMYGLDEFPEVHKEIRSQLNSFYKSHGLKGLQKLLYEKDPYYYNLVDLKNSQRLIRAIEICVSSGKPYSSFLNKEKNKRPFVCKIIMVDIERSELYKRINERVDVMLREGLEDEARTLYPRDENILKNTIGYKEFFKFFNGEYSRDNAVIEIKKNTRRLAKRQITWNKKYDSFITISPNSKVDLIVEEINKL
jgi:tRNA dimethylallyltransferase